MILAETSIQLVPDGTLLLHLLMIGIMVAVLNRTLLKPVNEILSRREKEVTGRLTEAQNMMAESQEKLRKYNEELREARAEGYRLLEKERAEGLRQKEEKLRLYRDEMAREVAAQLDTTRREQQSARAELDQQAASIADLISGQILRRPGQN